MKRFGTIVAAAIAIGALGASPRAEAQLGPWSQQYPGWVDANGNGLVDTGEVSVYPEAVWNDQLPADDPDRLYVRLVNNPWDACPGHLETRINATPLLNPTTISRRRGDRTQTVGGTLPTFSFTETRYVPPVPAIVGTAPRRVRVLDEIPTANGSGSLVDPNGDGVYEGLTVGGQNGDGTVPDTNLSFIYRDVNGDGKNDYVSLPWALTGVLGVKPSGDCVGGGGAAPQVWLPLYDSDGDGAPDTVSVRFPDPSTQGVGGLDGPPINAAENPGFPVPAASVLGLVAFAAALVGAGVFLLRTPGA